MTVWDLARSTMEQFSKAIASQPGELDAEQIYNDFLRAFWSGEFEAGGECAVCLPAAEGDMMERPDGTWRSFWTRADGSPWTGDIHGVQPRPFVDFTRQDLRQAVQAHSHVKMLTDDDGNLPFEVLADLTAQDYDPHFRETYLDQLLIETTAVKAWRERILKRPATDEPQQSLTHPKTPAPSAISASDAWHALIERMPERDLIKALPNKVAIAAVAAITLFEGERPSMPAQPRLDKINAYLRASSLPTVSKDTLNSAFREVGKWRRQRALHG